MKKSLAEKEGANVARANNWQNRTNNNISFVVVVVVVVVYKEEIGR